MRQFGLIGFPLGHSFSKKYFTEKFEKEQINAKYELYELKNISEFPDLLRKFPEIEGLNVTLPYKEQVIAYLDELDESAASAKAVNVIKIINGKKIGFNSDVYGFEVSLVEMINAEIITQTQLQALVLGTGGASKAVEAVLRKLNINYQLVARKRTGESLSNLLLYSEVTKDLLLKNRLIINTTPVGMYPNVEACPELPYEALSENHYLFDLVYNPEQTAFMKKGIERNATVRNGIQMLHLQAERAWQIWDFGG